METLISSQHKMLLVLLTTGIFLVACSSASPATSTNTPLASQDVDSTRNKPTKTVGTVKSTNTPVSPTETPIPAKEAFEPEPEVGEPTEPTATNTPEMTVEYYQTVPIGSTADFSTSDDLAGIEGMVEVRSETEIVVRDFVSLVAEAPGVDIRLGVDGDVSDDVAVVLRDITGKTYEGRMLTLTIPDSAFDGRTYDTIAVMCFDTGEIFDLATFELP